MSEYSQLVDEFFTRYEEPVIEQLTVGFAGIDPPLRVLASEIDHEGLNHLLGGDETGHYHLTKDQWEKIIKLLEGGSLPEPDPEPQPEPQPEDWDDYDGGNASTTDSEYNSNSEHWLDGQFAAEEERDDLNGGNAA